MSLKFVACLLTCASLAYRPAVIAHGQENHEARAPGAASVVAPIVVSGEPVPRVTLALVRDSSGELAARIDVAHFRFTPDSGGDGDGRALLTIDGAPVAVMRTAQVPVPRLSRGSHDVRAALVGNDGAPYVFAGRPIAAHVVYRAGMPDGEAGTGTLRTFVLDIANGQVAPDMLRVTQGDSVQLQWRSDAALDLHLHGYDIEARVAPGAPVTMQFRADVGGRFPVALHDSQDSDAGGGGHGHRALLHLEVYPD